LALRIGP